MLGAFARESPGATSKRGAVHPFPPTLFPRWVIYNDQKVCASEKPPKDLGYIYFYQRVAS